MYYIITKLSSLHYIYIVFCIPPIVRKNIILFTKNQFHSNQIGAKSYSSLKTKNKLLKGIKIHFRHD